MIKNKFATKYLPKLLIVTALTASLVQPIQANAAVVNFNCPGGGTYTVNNGILEDIYQGECVGAVVLDASVTQINYATAVAETVTSIEIPSTTTIIQAQPFTVGYGLTSITVNAANPNYKSVNGILYSKDGTTLIQYPQAKSGSTFTVPSSVTTISEYAFSCAINLNVVTIPDSVTMADNIDRINGCGENGITEFVIGAGNANYSAIDGVIFNKSGTTILAYPFSKPGASYVMPSSVTAITNQALAYSKNHQLLSITLSPNLTSIGTYSFSNLHLATLNLPASLTSISLLGLHDVNALTLDSGNSSFSLENGVLYNASKTTLVYYPSGKTSRTLTVPSSVTQFATYAFSSSGNNLIRLVIGSSLSSIGGYNYISTLRYLVITGDTSADFTNLALGNLVSVNYCGTNSTTLNHINTKLASWNNATLACAPNAPTFTLSKSIERPLTNTSISGYTIASTTPSDSYSITPDPGTYGLSFNSITGLLSGTWSEALGTSVDFSIMGTNSYGDTLVTFTVSTGSPAPIYVEPIPVPYLKTVTTPQIHLKDGKLICAPGTYQEGYSLNGVPQGNSNTLFTPGAVTYNLLNGGITNTALTVTSSTGSATWTLAQATSKSVVTCSVTVSANGVINTDKSSDNTSGVSSALSTQSTAIATANADYSASLSTNSKAYQKALVDNRATWRGDVEKNRATYLAELNRIASLGASKNTHALTSTALKTYITTQKKIAADYAASKPAALAAKELANVLALATRDAGIAKANSAYGTFIESIGYGVLIP